LSNANYALFRYILTRTIRLFETLISGNWFKYCFVN